MQIHPLPPPFLPAIEAWEGTLVSSPEPEKPGAFQEPLYGAASSAKPHKARGSQVQRGLPKPDEVMGQSMGLFPGPLPERIQRVGLCPYPLSLGGGETYTHFMEEVIETRIWKLKVRAPY